MIFEVASHLEYAVKFPTTLIFNIHAQKNPAQKILDERFTAPAGLQIEEFQLENEGSRFVRLQTANLKTVVIDYTATVECATEVMPTSKIDPTSIAEMDRSAIPYLFPSRYCQSDKLGRLAWDLFGKIPSPYEKVIAIVDWIHSNVDYVSGSTDSGTSAYDTVIQRTGVCRDFAHLGIALCRALNIPARYFSGYSYQLNPPDFHACFECHVGGRWLIFDATRLAPLNGLVRIGTGRDAADASTASIFGQVQLTSMKVSCQLAPGQTFTPLAREQQTRKAISLESSHVAATN